MNIPGYEIVERLREGSTATVWTAIEQNLDRPVLIYELNSDGSAQDVAEIARIHAQARAVGRLKHPSIVPVTDVGKHGDICYVITEHIEGKTAADFLLDRSPLPECDVLRLAEPVAHALDQAWNEASLIHGNLKPDNIFLATDGRVMLSGLGLARKTLVSDEASGTWRDIIIGTPNYMSPEQVMGMVALDFRSDIYSLGATMYHLATGQRPFHDTDAEKAMYMHMKGRVPFPRDLNPALSMGLSLLLLRMMMKNRDNRHSSWAKAAADMKQLKAVRVFLPRDVDNCPSTVSPPSGAIDPAEAARARRRKIAETMMMLVRTVKWAGLTALWVGLAWKLLQIPAE